MRRRWREWGGLKGFFSTQKEKPFKGLFLLQRATEGRGGRNCPKEKERERASGSSGHTVLLLFPYPLYNTSIDVQHVAGAATKETFRTRHGHKQ